MDPHPRYAAHPRQLKPVFCLARRCASTRCLDALHVFDPLFPLYPLLLAGSEHFKQFQLSGEYDLEGFEDDLASDLPRDAAEDEPSEDEGQGEAALPPLGPVPCVLSANLGP